MCLFPRLILNPKYKANKKNGGVIPPVSDERTKYVPIGCNTCMECKKQKARGWQARLTEDIKTHTNGKFVTLTFSDEKYKEVVEKILSNPKLKTKPVGYELDNAVAIYAVRHFLEIWRKHTKKSVRHWLVTELGHKGTENIHLHGIIWCENVEDVARHWKYGYTWIGNMKNGKRENYVNNKTINYIIKYIHKLDKDHKHYDSIVLTSPGIGGNFTKSPDFNKHKYEGTKTREYYRTPTGAKISLPIYYRNKLYNEHEREALWLQRLDKYTRYVLGEPVNIKNGEKEYWEALKVAQELNKELGYLDINKNTWEQEQYEREIRILRQRERIAKAYKKNNKEVGEP